MSQEEDLQKLREQNSNLMAQDWEWKKIRVTTEIEVLRPPNDTKESLEFRYNDGTWCAENLPLLIETYIDRGNNEDDPLYRGVHGRIERATKIEAL